MNGAVFCESIEDVAAYFTGTESPEQVATRKDLTEQMPGQAF